MEEEKTLLEATLVLCIDKDHNVLLGVKTRKIGKDCRNGYGGGVEKFY